jgi:hypothetical protein
MKGKSATVKHEAIVLTVTWPGGTAGPHSGYCSPSQELSEYEELVLSSVMEYS